MRRPPLNFLTKKAPYKGLGADSEEKHEPVSDIDTAAVDSLKVLDPKRPIREANIRHASTLGVPDVQIVKAFSAINHGGDNPTSDEDAHDREA